MKKLFFVWAFVFLSNVALHAQDDVSLTDFYISVGYSHQPYSSLNQSLEASGYQSFNAHVGTLGGGFSYLPKSGLGIFAETQLNVNRKGFSNAVVSYRYLPTHVTAGVQYHFLYSGTADYRIYPKLGFFFGT